MYISIINITNSQEQRHIYTPRNTRKTSRKGTYRHVQDLELTQTPNQKQAGPDRPAHSLTQNNPTPTPPNPKYGKRLPHGEKIPQGNVTPPQSPQRPA